jgi:molybdopterin-guanine dinucleotide biosynthesis protein A
VITEITGVVLAGGKSSRMGTNKALLPYQNRPLIETILQIMESIFSRVIVSVNQTYENVTQPQIPDRYPETGPIGGITSVLESGEKRIFCVGCDMPFLNPKLIEFICTQSDCDAVIPVWRGKIEVLHAYYSSSLLPHLQQSLKENRFRITDSFGEAHVRYIQEPEIKPFDPQGSSFRNVNTPEEYREIAE